MIFFPSTIVQRAKGPAIRLILMKRPSCRRGLSAPSRFRAFAEANAAKGLRLASAPTEALPNSDHGEIPEERPGLGHGEAIIEPYRGPAVCRRKGPAGELTTAACRTALRAFPGQACTPPPSKDSPSTSTLFAARDRRQRSTRPWPRAARLSFRWGESWALSTRALPHPRRPGRDPRRKESSARGGSDLTRRARQVV